MNRQTGSYILASALVLLLQCPAARADQPRHDTLHDDLHNGQEARDTTDHVLRHLVDHAKEIGLSPDQLMSVKALQLDFDLVRIKGEAEIMLTEREIAAMFKDDKTEVPTVEAKIRESEAMRAGLRVASLKALRKVMALLTPEQREKSRRILATESKKTDLHS